MKFETIYNKIDKTQSDLQRYTDFIRLTNKKIHNEEVEIVNIWSFEQNELKNSHSGKETLKQMCSTYYYEAINNI